MASVKIYDSKHRTKKISENDNFDTKINDIVFQSKLSEKGMSKTKHIEETNSHNAKIVANQYSAKLNNILQFRVRFTNIQIPAAAGGIPPIGIAIIGVNNYIL